MNVYDFDNTIFQGDSTAGFIPYCWKKRPKSLFNLPRTAVCGLLYILHLMPKKTFKQNMYHMFAYIPDMEKLVDEYSQERIGRVKKWYLNQQKEDDLVISASPSFLVKSFCEKIGIHQVIASPVDIHTGIYSGENCHGQEKVVQWEKHYSGKTIDQFYSDSKSDTPLAKLAKQAYLVKGEQVQHWPL